MCGIAGIFSPGLRGVQQAEVQAMCDAIRHRGPDDAGYHVQGRVGLGMLIPALNVGAVQSLAGTELAYASAGVNFVRQLGGAIGVNLLAVVLEWRLGTVGAANPAKPFHECFVIVTLAFAFAIVPAWFIRPEGGRHVSEDPRRVRRFARKPSRRR